MRVIVLAVLIALAMPAAIFGQRAESTPRWTITPRTGPASDGWPRDPPPRFTIPPRGTVGLPEIGLPLPPIGLQPPADEQSRRGRRPGRAAIWPSISYFGAPFFGWEYYDPRYYNPRYYDPRYYGGQEPEDPAPAAAIVEPPAPGRLILDPQPEGTQVFVDGYYAGIPDDFSAGQGGGVLAGGVHRIDMSAPGYEPVSLDVNIAPAQTVTYRGTMQPITKVQVEPAAPTIFYLIPGCYMGNVPPGEVRLPASCDLRKVVEFKQ